MQCIKTSIKNEYCKKSYSSNSKRTYHDIYEPIYIKNKSSMVIQFIEII